MHREKLSTISNNRLQVQTPSPIQKLRIECGHLNMHTSSSTQVHVQRTGSVEQTLHECICVCVLTVLSLDRFNDCHGVCVCVQVCCT